jgi:predicted outer membrane repeat protein
VKLTILLLALLAVVASGRVILVPDSAATIQAGLALARSGDTVLVSPGTYQENLTWPSYDGIKLLSAAGPESTVVDGEYAGTCLTMSSGSLTRATLVSGFTFANGYHATGGAAGISCAGNATIAGNRITRCNGVGVYLNNYSTSFSPLLIGNEIDGCFKEIENYNYGCGILVNAGTDAHPEICYNYIHHDTLRNSARNYGGGIYCEAEALIYQNRIEANVLYSDTGSACRAYGAGIFVDMSRRPLIFNNLIIGNRCATDAWKYGAGIRAYLYAKPLIIGNTIAGNVCEGPHMWSNGGGIYNDISCTTWVKNNIITGNQATSGSGIYNEAGSGGVINTSHNDYYNNALYGCSYGAGDITQNPLFVTGPQGEYCLSQVAAGQAQNSPCLDAGDTLEMTTPLDLDSLLRTWTTRTDSIIDMLELDMGYHYPGGILLGVAEEGLRPQASSPTLQATPNPFRTSLTLAFSPREREGVRVRIFDAQGRVVADLSGANSGRIVWDASRLPAGVYCYRVVAAGSEHRGRVVKLD